MPAARISLAADFNPRFGTIFQADGSGEKEEKGDARIFDTASYENKCVALFVAFFAKLSMVVSVAILFDCLVKWLEAIPS